MLKNMVLVWGRPVGRRVIISGISSVFTAACSLLVAVLNIFATYFTNLIQDFSNLHKLLIISVKYLVIPIIHSAYNKERLSISNNLLIRRCV